MASQAEAASGADASDDPLRSRLETVRALTLALAEPLSDADATVQSMEDASPAKWHLAHTTWFFETFVLRDHAPGYEAYDEDFAFLFNSYYEAEGPRHARPSRGLITRPSLDEVRAYRAHVDGALEKAWNGFGEKARETILIGTHHEQQHQELLLTDILHLFSCNPLKPAVWPPNAVHSLGAAPPLEWIEGEEGCVEIGHDGGGFAFDCEGPRHKVMLEPHALANRPVTNGEWQAFILDGGYERAEHWLSDGWAWVREQGIDAPLYWSRDEDGRWCQFGLDGVQPLDPAAPVCHVSLYEADAYASWAGFRLPTEAEWEHAAAKTDPAKGHVLEVPGPVRPAPAAKGSGLLQMFGDVWEWTGSAYRPYPGFRAAEGAIGEYNGKFMSGQFVLKGGSVATPADHVRACYRNFFYPHQRWQFTGVRLARDI